jgi:hypothetical protein
MDEKLSISENVLKNPGLPLMGQLEEVIFADNWVFLPVRHVSLVALTSIGGEDLSVW